MGCIDMGDIPAFCHELSTAADKTPDALEDFLQKWSDKFLERVQAEIMARGVVDTGRLLGSFCKSAGGGLTLEVGTDVPYAAAVNDGHVQQPGRFVPGHMSGGKFTYDASAKTGIRLKAGWVEGAHFWEGALDAQDNAEKLMREVWDALFGTL